MDKRHTVAWSLAILATVVACAKPPEIRSQPPEQAAQYELLSFIEDGVTTRTEVLNKLGTPSAQFEGERILTYRIKVEEEKATPVLAPWKPGMLSLVLVFSDDDVLAKHSLIGGGDTQ